MIPDATVSGRDPQLTSALAAGLAATVIMWIAAVAFAPEQVEALSQYSPWLYGPAAIGVWALFSAVSYWLISRYRRSASPLISYKAYSCPELRRTVAADARSLCANQKERNRLAAANAGFALTIAAWVTALSFMPEAWLDWLAQAPPFTFCVLSAVLWLTWSTAMFQVFRASQRKSQ